MLLFRLIQFSTLLVLLNFVAPSESMPTEDPATDFNITDVYRGALGVRVLEIARMLTGLGKAIGLRLEHLRWAPSASTNSVASFWRLSMQSQRAIIPFNY